MSCSYCSLQLEIEIFRQLQLRRRDDRPSDSSDVYATSGGSSSSSSSSSAQPKSLTSSNVASMSSPSSLPSSRTSADSRQSSGVAASKSGTVGRYLEPSGTGFDETMCRHVASRDCDDIVTPAVGRQSLQIGESRQYVGCKPPKVPGKPCFLQGFRFLSLCYQYLYKKLM